MYPEYTGTGLLVILQTPDSVAEKLSANKEDVYNYVGREFFKKYNLNWLKPIGFNNAYALMMRKKEAEKLDIETISDLKKYVNQK
jgi:osmoprotectant transport system permease protein